MPVTRPVVPLNPKLAHVPHLKRRSYNVCNIVTRFKRASKCEPALTGRVWSIKLALCKLILYSVNHKEGMRERIVCEISLNCSVQRLQPHSHARNEVLNKVYNVQVVGFQDSGAGCRAQIVRCSVQCEGYQL